MFDFDGFKLGVVGYTLPELATLIFPGYLDPFKVTDPAAAINAEIAKLTRQSKVNAVIAVGHIGRRRHRRCSTRPATSSTSPTACPGSTRSSAATRTPSTSTPARTGGSSSRARTPVSASPASG